MSDSINNTIGNNLKTFMGKKDCSITKLALETGLSTSKISRIRTGHGCKIKQLDAIAKVLGYDTADFFQEPRINPRNSDLMNLLAVINGMAKRRDPEETTVGSSIRRERTNRHITQSYLAEKIGVTQATISEIETDDRDATTGIMWAISQELDVPVEVLLPPPRHHVTGDVWAARKFVLERLKQNPPI